MQNYEVLNQNKWFSVRLGNFAINLIIINLLIPVNYVNRLIQNMWVCWLNAISLEEVDAWCFTLLWFFVRVKKSKHCHQPLPSDLFFDIPNEKENSYLNWTVPLLSRMLYMPHSPNYQYVNSSISQVWKQCLKHNTFPINTTQPHPSVAKDHYNAAQELWYLLDIATSTFTYVYKFMSMTHPYQFYQTVLMV